MNACRSANRNNSYNPWNVNNSGNLNNNNANNANAALPDCTIKQGKTLIRKTRCRKVISAGSRIPILPRQDKQEDSDVVDLRVSTTIRATTQSYLWIMKM